MNFNKNFFKSSISINIAIVLVFFISINIIFSKILINKKIDLTEDKLFTLSTNTKNVIKETSNNCKLHRPSIPALK